MKAKKCEMILPKNFMEMNDLERSYTGGDPGAEEKIMGLIEEMFPAGGNNSMVPVKQPVKMFENVPVANAAEAGAAAANAEAAAAKSSGMSGNAIFCVMTILQTATSVIQDAKKMPL